MSADAGSQQRELVFLAPPAGIVTALREVGIRLSPFAARFAEGGRFFVFSDYKEEGAYARSSPDSCVNREEHLGG